MIAWLCLKPAFALEDKATNRDKSCLSCVIYRKAFDSFYSKFIEVLTPKEIKDVYGLYALMESTMDRIEKFIEAEDCIEETNKELRSIEGSLDWVSKVGGLVKISSKKRPKGIWNIF